MKEIKAGIKESIQAFAQGSLSETSLALFKALGYNTKRQSPLDKKTYQGFQEAYLDGAARFNGDKALVREWKYIDLLFQLSKDEITTQHGLLDTRRVDRTIIETYLFFVIELSKDNYSRTALSHITREINKVFPMPVMVLFKHGQALTLSVINRRLHKRDEQKDVLEKVTLIKDIHIGNPHRAHIEILFDLSFEELLRKYKFTNFVALHNAWADTLNMDSVTDAFYKKFKPLFDDIVTDVRAPAHAADQKTREDFVLLFAIRVIFIGFIQRRRWIGDSEDFLKEFLGAYQKSDAPTDTFYSSWLVPLFFESLNNPPGRPAALDNKAMPDAYKKALQMAPYLNGGLFIRKPGVDDLEFTIPDAAVERYFSFIFSYYFTIEENTPLDEEIGLNPEFLGIIFERLVNKENGAVYTPRTEVDFMCRMALVKWLETNNTTKVALKDLYELFFREGGPEARDDHQRRGDFTAAQKKDLIDLLETVTVCDPAVGSGAFLVGMLHVLDDVEQCLRGRIRDADYKEETFHRKQRVISRSLYGVEVKGWAVWITHLRLWITLFIDAPESIRMSFAPILPSLDFKVRQGDSLVQRIGKKMFPVSGHADIPPAVKAKVTRLKELKVEFFQNKHKDSWEIKQAEYRVFKDILHAEIDEKRKTLRELGDKPDEQMDLFGGGKEERQQKLELFKDRIEGLKAEIDELQEEMQALREERPLVWNIEFAEIFFDKGGFDIVIGNPPYVRQEAIADPLGKIKIAKEYKDALAGMVQGDFPREFRKEKLNAQSDLYTYFYIRSLRLLNDKGVHVFICSNSWLDVGYGVWLQKFLLNYAPVHFIFDNHSKRSFAAADVNTIISVIGAPVKKVEREHMVKFVAFKLPFEEVIFTENLLEIERARAVEANEKFRVYPITDEELFKSGLEADEDAPGIAATGKYVGDKWGGKFLRAPDIFFTILEKGKGKLVRLGDIADVRFGIKTGANEFFYLDDEAIKTWGIEKEFLKPVIKSPRECKTIEVDINNLPNKIFWCKRSKDKLKGTNALKYILASEKAEIIIKGGINGGGKIIGYQNLTSIKSRKVWYDLGGSRNSAIAWSMMHAQLHNVYYNSTGIELDHNFFEIIPFDESQEFNLSMLCVSTLSIFVKELFGRCYGGGSGPLKNEGVDIKKYLTVRPELLSLREEDFKGFLRREMRPVLEELGVDGAVNIRNQEPRPLPDRKRLDDIVFDAIGLTAAERKEVYWSVCELVKNRLDKAGSV